MGATCPRVVAGRWLQIDMNLNDIEKIDTAEHLLEINLSNKPDRWNLKITKNGKLRESYRPLTKDEVIQVILGSLRKTYPDQQAKAQERVTSLPESSIDGTRIPQCECLSQEGSS